MRIPSDGVLEFGDELGELAMKLTLAIDDALDELAATPADDIAGRARREFIRLRLASLVELRRRVRRQL